MSFCTYKRQVNTAVLFYDKELLRYEQVNFRSMTKRVGHYRTLYSFKGHSSALTALYKRRFSV
jgi:hypothetical protein